MAIFGVTVVIVIVALPESIRLIPIILAVLVGIAALLVLIPASILFNIVVVFAQRAIVVEDIGPIAAIKSGARLLRSKLGPSLLVWLINVAVSILGGLILVAAMVVTVVPLAIVGLLIYMAIGFGGPLIVYLVLAGLVLIVVVWALSAVVNTYFWSYWTIAYLRLTGREVVV